MNRKILTLAAVPVLAVTLAACGHGSGKLKADAAKASARATSSAVQADKVQAQQLAKQCLPASETAQLRLAEPAKGKAGRQAVDRCLAIPPQNRQAFDDALLNAAVHGHLSTKAGRDAFAAVTVPQLVVKYR